MSYNCNKMECSHHSCNDVKVTVINAYCRLKTIKNSARAVWDMLSQSFQPWVTTHACLNLPSPSYCLPDSSSTLKNCTTGESNSVTPSAFSTTNRQSALPLDLYYCTSPDPIVSCHFFCFRIKPQTHKFYLFIHLTMKSSQDLTIYCSVNLLHSHQVCFRIKQAY